MAEEKKKKEWNATGAFDCLAVTSVQVYPFKEGPSMGHIKGLASVVLNDQFLVRSSRAKNSAASVSRWHATCASISKIAFLKSTRPQSPKENPCSVESVLTACLE